ncbi:GNAT family N-acetyltransferase [Cryobacterium suzukii]|uniref:GNAT family N-acetyltransferase n=1 Tax=Cryobacterium suzukii TaxID=1259198 RepID=UPI001F541174|nr:GNAT family N-acetyltransferase [Cryobacterium suzukii]
MLRESEPGDRSAVIDLLGSPEMCAHLGGPQPRDELERAVPEIPGHRPGYFVVDRDGATIGIVTFDRRDAERPGHIHPDGGEAELSYNVGIRYATEACAAALRWFAGALPGELVVLCTQSASDASVRVAAKLGFTETERFEEYGAEPWFGVWSSGSPSV